MTREEIMQLNTDYLNGCESEHKMNELFSYTLSQEPCDDAISREAVIEKLNELDWQELYLPIHFKEHIIDELPSVTQKSGKWGTSCTCSVCGQWRILESEKNDGKYKYCPNCGAKMESEEQE